MASTKLKKNLITPEMLAERDRLIADRAAAIADLASAEQKFRAAEAVEQEIDARTGNVIVGHGHPLRTASIARSAAKNALDDVKMRLSNVTSTLQTVETTCSAPAEVERIEAEIAAIHADRVRIQAALADAERRLADLTAKAVTLAASEATAEGAAADAMGQGLPLDVDALGRLASERRVVAVTLERLTAQAAQHRADLDELREREKDARQNLRVYRAICARLEVEALLRPIMPALVRATIMAGDNPRRIEVAVPQGVIDAVEAEMAEPGV
jgi:chromosome segregation ATPase